MADVAEIVVEGAKRFRAQAKIERQVLANFPIVLREDAEVVAAVLVIVQAAAAKAELRCAEQEVLKIGVAIRRVGEEEFAVEQLRDDFVRIHAGECAAVAEYVRS